jgi:hypothetical protein
MAADGIHDHPEHLDGAAHYFLVPGTGHYRIFVTSVMGGEGVLVSHGRILGQGQAAFIWGVA